MKQPATNNPAGTSATEKKDGPEPLEDLQVEWQNEDIESEGRKPNLEEYEEDTSAL
jgi:hypothetical protein